MGGGLFSLGGTLNLLNATVASNSASGAAGYGGGVYTGLLPGAFNATNSIFAGNTASTAFPDFAGLFGTAYNNLLQDGTGAGGIINGVDGNLVGANPLLGVLADNG